MKKRPDLIIKTNSDRWCYLCTIRCAAVYVVYGRSKKDCLYVGASKNINIRMSHLFMGHHHNIKKYDPRCMSVEIYFYPEGKHLKQEKLFIKKLQPKRNEREKGIIKQAKECILGGFSVPVFKEESKGGDIYAKG